MHLVTPSRSCRGFLPAPALALVLGLVTVVLWPDRAPNPDAVSYLKIAEYWARGEWQIAFNTYWSPLLSWSIAPLVACGLESHDAARIVSVLTGCTAVVQLQRLMRRLNVSAAVRNVMGVAAVPLAVFAMNYSIGPDLLMTTLLLGFVAEITRESFSAPRAGLWAGLAFLAKAYALPFALAALAATVLVRAACLGRRRAGLRRALATASITVVVALPWVVPVSLDQDTLTISAASRYHRDITAPGSLGYAYEWAGLIEPEHTQAVWAWEDPSSMPTPADRPQRAAARRLETRGDLAPGWRYGRAGRLIVNLGSVAVVFAMLFGSTIAAAFAIVSAIGAPRPGEADARDRKLVMLVLAACAALYIGGLVVLVVQVRYFYLPLFVCIALAAAWLSERRPRARFSRTAIYLVAATTAVGPLAALSLAFERAGQFAEVHRFLGSSVDEDLDGLRVASLPPHLREIGAACFEFDCVYLGAPRLDAAEPLEAQLDAFDVDVLVTSGEHDVAPLGSTKVAVSTRKLGLARNRYTVYRMAR